MDELRLRIAKKLGWDVIEADIMGKHYLTHNGEELPDWPNDIRAAWELAEEMPKLNLAKSENGWDAVVNAKWEFGNFIGYDFFAVGITASEAICRAWLKWKNLTMDVGATDGDINRQRQEEAQVKTMENAELIAVEPDLVETCKALMEGLDDYWITTPDGIRIVNSARRAIASAEGGNHEQGC